jgi:hypothetical protein
MMPRTTVAAALCLLVAGCGPSILHPITDTADVFPLNDAARKIGIPQASFVRQGTGQGPVTITMPDGKILTGTYRVAFNTATSTDIGFGFAGHTAVTSFATTQSVGSGIMQFVARGPQTALLCKGYSTPAGHGQGQCETEEGALWTISW